MVVVWNFVPLLLAILLSYHESETASTVFVTKPSNPSFAVEGRDFTLLWTYTLDGTVYLSQFFNISVSGNKLIGKGRGPGNISSEQGYQARFRALATKTRAELTILAVKRSDQSTYRMAVDPSGSGTLTHDVAVIVRYQPSIILISVNQTVKVGDMLMLNCTADSFPPPNITWTRLSTNRIVGLPLNITGKQDEGFYMCTADNGVGNPATADVFITVHYKPEHVSLKISTNKVCAGAMVTFTCLAGDANPAIQNYILHVNNGSGLVNISSNQLGVFTRPMFTEGQDTYTCEASNSVGRTSSSRSTVDVEVRASVTIIANETIIVVEGGNVTLRCRFSGLPLPNISWINNSLSYIVDTESILMLLNISRYSAGVYTCSATNACGSDSKNVYIDVQYRVKATGNGENATVAEGEVHRFLCPVDGNPDPNIQWYNEETGRKISSGKQYETGESGCYSCIASNYLGPPVNITQCLIVDPNLTLAPTTTVSQQSTTSAPFTTKPTRAEPEGLAGPPWAIIGAAAGGVLVLGIGVGVLTWWVHKQRKCRKDTKSKEQTLLASRRSHESRQQSCCWPPYKRVVSNV